MDWTSDAARFLIAQGVLGLAVLVLGVAVFFLWRELQAKDDKLVETLTAWREDTKQTSTAMASLLDKAAIIAEVLRDATPRRRQ